MDDPNNESFLIVLKGGFKIWRNIHNQWHRLDGPAYDSPNGHKEWWVNDVLHRTDGPAIESPFGYHEYYLNGKKLDILEFFLLTKNSS